MDCTDMAFEKIEKELIADDYTEVELIDSDDSYDLVSVRGEESVGVKDHDRHDHVVSLDIVGVKDGVKMSVASTVYITAYVNIERDEDGYSETEYDWYIENWEIEETEIGDDE